MMMAIAVLAATVSGVSAIDLDTGKRYEVNASDTFPMASVYKLPVAIALMQRVDRGELSLVDDVTIKPEEFHAGHSPIAAEANGKPVTMSLGLLLAKMLGESDNTALDYVFAHYVPPADVRAMLKKIGVSGVDVSRPEAMIIGEILNEPDVIETPASYAARTKSMTKKDEAEGLKKFWNDKRDTSTPRGMVELLAKLYRHQVGLSAEAEEVLLRILRETTTGPDRIRAGVPRDATVAHKTGTMPGTMNDVGIVTSADGKHHVAMAIFTKWSHETEEERAKVVAGIAATVWRRLQPATK